MCNSKTSAVHTNRATLSCLTEVMSTHLDRYRAREVIQERLSESLVRVILERRRAKAALLIEDLPALEKQVKKGKKLTPEVVNDRASKVKSLATLQAIRL